jgi:hypothetical protein
MDALLEFLVGERVVFDADRQKLVEVRRLGDAVGQEEILSLTEKDVFQVLEWRGMERELVPIDNPRHIDLDVVGQHGRLDVERLWGLLPLKVAAKDGSRERG